MFSQKRNSMHFGAEIHLSQAPRFRAIHPCASYVTLIRLHFHTCKVEIIIPSSQGCCIKGSEEVNCSAPGMYNLIKCQFFLNCLTLSAILVLPNYILLSMYQINLYNKRKLNIGKILAQLQKKMLKKKKKEKKENARASQDTLDSHLLFIK